MKPPPDSFKILIIDDELIIRNLVHGVLTRLGFKNITMVNSGAAALELIANNRFDFIITDWCMEDMDGIDIVHKVRDRQGVLGSTPIVMLTGYTDVSYVKTAIDAGISAYLIKPFSADHLSKRIRSVMESPRDFIVSEKYKGPDRRHISKPPRGGVDQRKPKKK